MNGYDDEYRLTEECEHPLVDRIRPKAIPAPGPDVVVRFTCPGCGAKGVHRFRYQAGDQREPGAWWGRVMTAVGPHGADEYPVPGR